MKKTYLALICVLSASLFLALNSLADRPAPGYVPPNYQPHAYVQQSGSKSGYAVAPAPGAVACSMEAKACPDGSYVSRSGPHCEFAPCPAGKATTPPRQGTTGPVVTAPPADPSLEEPPEVDDCDDNGGCEDQQSDPQ